MPPESSPSESSPSAPPPPDSGPPARLPPDLAAFRGRVSPSALDYAQRRARRVGIGGDEALLAAGLVDPDMATSCLAAHFGLAVDPLDGARALPGWRAVAALRTGVLAALGPDGAPAFTLALRGREARHLARAFKADPGLRRRVRLVSPERLRAHLEAEAGEDLDQLAAFALRDRHPAKSAATLSPARLVLAGLAVAVAPLAAGFALAPAATLLLAQALLSAVFLSWIALRLAACLYDPPPDPAALPRDRDLPVYSLLVPLYREAKVVPRLAGALRALDYPPEKLDIKLVVEADDAETRAAIAAQRLPAYFETIVSPAMGPRTKPKALNAGLAFARGDYVAVYDAEDEPEPDQLRRALAAFGAGGGRVGCVQARLAIDNGGDSWVSRHFAAEYAALFDVLLPALAGLGLPVLLGGTSNHFRRDVLERVGAWDPFNVTEDADLGVRLARAGWRTAVIGSSTQEEAPVSVPAWLGQRTRWLKGWAQTLLVHGRTPRALVRDLGPKATLALLLLTAGPYAAALVHPLCLGILAMDLWGGVLGQPGANMAEVLAASLAYTTLVVGYGAAAATAVLGLKRRRLLWLAPVLVTLPAYWLLLSVAAWRAVGQLVTRPHFWNKTEHGLARRRVPAKGGAALRGSASDRPPPRRAAAWR